MILLVLFIMRLAEKIYLCKVILVGRPVIVFFQS